jgi:hypothetical protein
MLMFFPRHLVYFLMSPDLGMSEEQALRESESTSSAERHERLLA